jgi:hypothetical protein
MMQEFKFLNDNKDDGIIGAYNEADLLVQLTDRNTERTFMVPLPLIYSIRVKACRLYVSPLGSEENNIIEYQGLYRYQITGVQEVGYRRLRYWATIWFYNPIGNILCYHLTETIRP